MIRKLSSKKDEEKKNKRNQWILGMILVVVMFGSVFGIVVNSFNNEDEDNGVVEYQGYSFVPQGNYYSLELGNSIFYFSQNPESIEGIANEVNLTKLLPMYSGKIIYLQSEKYEISNLIYQNLGNYAQRIQQACESEIGCQNENYPIKDCSNNFIIIKEGEENKIYENSSCVYIEGQKEDLEKLTNEFLLYLVGVKQ